MNPQIIKCMEEIMRSTRPEHEKGCYELKQQKGSNLSNKRDQGRFSGRNDI